MDFLKKFFHIKFAFIIIILFGLSLRLYFIFSRDIFTDEVSYTNVAISNSFTNILTSSHWIKDHGALFLLALKVLAYLSKNIIVLRLFNLIPYIISCFVLFNFFKKLKIGHLSLISVFVYSFSSYFVYLSAMISPFNLVSFLALLALISLIKYLFFEKTLRRLSTFALLSIMTFYADFSSFYFFLGLIIVLFLLYLKKRKDFSYIIVSYLVILIGVLPGIFHVINKFNEISLLNPDKSSVNLNFFKFLTVFSNNILLRMNGQPSLVLLAASLFILAMHSLKSTQEKPINFVSKLFLASFLLNTTFLFVFSKQFFSIFVERSFWHFYLVEVFIITLISWYLRTKKQYLAGFLITVLLIISIRFINGSNYSFPGVVPDFNIKYKELTNKIKKIPSFNQYQIIYYDQEYFYVPLKEYYLKDYTNNSLVLTKDNNSPCLLSKPTILIVFDINNKGTFERIKNNIRYLDKNCKIFVYITKCSQKNCNFFQIY